MNAEEARELAKYVYDNTKNLEKELFKKIEDCASRGMFYFQAEINFKHNTNYIVKKLEERGFKVKYHIFESLYVLCGKYALYDISWEK